MSVYHGYDPALTGGVAIADSLKAASTTWSSNKIDEEIQDAVWNLETALQNTVDATHTHSNESTLALLGTDSGKLTYDGATYDNSSAVDTKISNYGYSKAEIDAKVSSVYKPKGSMLFANLPAPAQSSLGFVYDVTDGFTTTAALFTDGGGKTYPAGTNVMVVQVESDYKYDVLSGFVDLSNYLQSSQIETETENINFDSEPWT